MTGIGYQVRKVIESGREDITYPKDKYSLTFEEFSSYIAVLPKNKQMNPHWASVLELCQPCLIHYDYLAKLETMDRDMKAILSRVGVPELYNSIPRYNAHGGKGEDMADYYKYVSSRHLFTIMEMFKNDTLLFGYGMPNFN